MKERGERGEERGEFFSNRKSIVGCLLSTVEFEYERKMMNRSTALLIAPIFTVEYSRNVKHSPLSTGPELSSE